MSTTPPTPSDPTTGSAARPEGNAVPDLTLAPARPRTLGSRATPTDRPPVPASAAWHEGDPVGRRQFADLGPLKLESGGRLPAVRLAYETWGELNEDGTNAVLVLHALTGDSHVTGEAGDGHPTPGWWSSMVGPGAPIDTDRWFVVAPNVLGGCQGSTGPASPGPDGRPWGSRFPLLTVRDQVAAEIRLSDLLGIDAWALVIGASLGGLRVLEWAASAPERVEAIAAIATAAQTSGDQIAGFHTQLAADPRRPALPRRRLLRRRRRRRPARRPRPGPADRAPDLPQRRRAGPAVRAHPAGRRAAARRAAGSRCSRTWTTTATS